MPTRQYTGKIEDVLVSTDRFSVFKVSHFSEVGATSPGDDQPENRTAVCTLGASSPTESWVLVTGNWRKHPTYSWQFAVDRLSPTMPQEAEAIREYLRSGEVDLIGEELADRLVDRFGSNTLKVMETSPLQLTVVKGIGEQRAESIGEHVRIKRQSQALAGNLTSLGVPKDLVPELHRVYGDYAFSRIKRNPYEILAARPFFRFDVAEAIAETIGYTGRSQALQSLITCAAHHVDSERSRLVVPIAEVMAYLGHHYPGRIQSAPDLTANLPHQFEISHDQSGEPHLIEKSIKSNLKTISDRVGSELKPTSLFAQAMTIARTSHPVGALKLIPDHFGQKHISVIDGSLGTQLHGYFGQFLEQTRSVAPSLNISLYSLSRQSQATITEEVGESVSLLWPVLKNTGKRSSRVDLMSDVVFVFEAEKLTLSELATLLGRVPDTCALVLVGDRLAQSAGPEFLYDQILSHCRGAKAVIELDAGRASAWHNQNHPLIHDPANFLEAMPSEHATPAIAGAPIHRFDSSDSEVTQKIVIDLVQTLQKQYQVTDFHVLAQTVSGSLGTIALNKLMQPILSTNPDQSTVPYVGDHSLHEGDRMSLKRATPKLDWPPNVLATVHEIHRDTQRLDLRLKTGQLLSLSFIDLKFANLGWATTVHPSPAQRFPFVVLVLNNIPAKAKWATFYRALAWTSRRLLIVGSPDTLKACIKKRPVDNEWPVSNVQPGEGPGS